ncbi:UDP-N-acetylmuramoyl-tripeptide--D-alanyl-D-alanine ligase [Ancylothrix sp. C2]|uniref:UDP-N-acetylmuramoyl-tripeptide--D-alanyl-D- alanine ligase n=1 Tax=Ancylothrix sp. D3o TaxID=2953691 RepID=UPI0021BB8511|nr:UDP-N-acetylmuramoyl-tripeptide--D-alanyl-D-alanine ligase [Ancylothrix sp. D3o]MCT7948705.1 UDP-N-acetylmuramoyl-tripeptide--D-alanyl-D-alanine ligase [Ancylothrix sp. D3o]
MTFCATLGQLSDVLDSTPATNAGDFSQIRATGICTDTRSLNAGEVFLALRGENFDGHAFVPAAVSKGAVAVIVECELPVEIPQFVVKDSLKAYQAIANWWRRQFSVPVIAVTGSFGKTTTKELISAVLETQGKVLKTQQNFNNEIGVPKTLLELSSDHDFAVIEMAMRGPGQIAELAEIAEPTIGVITNVGTAHIGLLGSKEAIAEAKCELLAEMPATSTAILNQDNELLMATAAQVWQGKTISYGLDGGDVFGKIIDGETVEVEGLRFRLPLAGRHNACNYLAALAVAKVLGISWEGLQAGVAVDLPEGRAKRYDLPGDVVILDESYNAGLESMKAALYLLAETSGKRHIAVLGTMRELGDRSLEFHENIGETVRDLKLDALFILADEDEAKAMAGGAVGVPVVEVFVNTGPEAKSTLLSRLKSFVSGGDCLLFKASHAVALDKVVEQFRSDW